VSLALLGIGWFLRELGLPKPIGLEKYQIGDLVDYMFVNLQSGDVDNLKRTASAVIETADGNDTIGGNATLLAKAFATGLLAEVQEAGASKQIDFANASIELFNQLLEKKFRTPLVHFMLATAHRILESDDAAIQEYHNYLALHPNDKDAESILKELISKLESSTS